MAKCSVTYHPVDKDDLDLLDLSYTHCKNCHKFVDVFSFYYLSLNHTDLLCETCFKEKQSKLGLKSLDGFDV